MKRFFDVFPTLKVKSDLTDYFSETEVERLTTNKEHTRIKVVLHSDHLIHKNRVYRMQDEISRQVFKERSPEVYIDEHYSLSAQYTPRRLMEEYRDSLVSEIASFSHVMGLYFREARVEYEGEESIRVIMEDSCLSRKLSLQLEEALNRIFRERCGVPAMLTVDL
jgi:DNA polymerase-3 subunit alpha (Gram-positive type)